MFFNCVYRFFKNWAYKLYIHVHVFTSLSSLNCVYNFLLNSYINMFIAFSEKMQESFTLAPLFGDLREELTIQSWATRVFKEELAILSVLSEFTHFELSYLGMVLREELTFLSWAADSSFLFIVLVFSSCWFLSMVASSKPLARSFNLTSWDCEIEEVHVKMMSRFLLKLSCNTHKSKLFHHK